MTLEIRINRIRTGRWGWSAGSGAPAQIDPYLGLGSGPGGPPAVLNVPRGDHAMFWDLDSDAAVGVSREGHRLKLRPFMGIMGMPLDQPGIQSTFPPTACGGNLDCRELTEGTALRLPIAVDGALFSTGDGHAVQGDGEVAGPALNCPMEVEMEFRLYPELKLTLPRGRVAGGWLTFGFSRSLDEAAATRIGKRAFLWFGAITLKPRLQWKLCASRIRWLRRRGRWKLVNSWGICDFGHTPRFRMPMRCSLRARLSSHLR
jgi:acetamidase/formamidase